MVEKNYVDRIQELRKRWAGNNIRDEVLKKILGSAKLSLLYDLNRGEVEIPILGKVINEKCEHKGEGQLIIQITWDEKLVFDLYYEDDDGKQRVLGFEPYDQFQNRELLNRIYNIGRLHRGV